MSPADLFTTKEVQKVLRAATEDQAIESTAFNNVVEQLPTLSEAWAAKAKAQLLAMAQSDLTTYLSPEKQNTSEEDLDLAAMAYAFECARCYRKMDWKGALVHPCVTDLRSSNSEVGHLMKDFTADTQYVPWNCRALRLDSLRLQHAFRVLESMGHDHKTVTPTQMNSLDEIVECNTCTSHYGGRLMLDWKLAVSLSMSDRRLAPF
jgi:hypothetical protein